MNCINGHRIVLMAIMWSNKSHDSLAYIRRKRKKNWKAGFFLSATVVKNYQLPLHIFLFALHYWIMIPCVVTFSLYFWLFNLNPFSRLCRPIFQKDWDKLMLISNWLNAFFLFINMFVSYKQLPEVKWFNPKAVRVGIFIAKVSLVCNYFGAGYI